MELLAYDRLERMTADERNKRQQQIVKGAERARLAALYGSGGPSGASDTEPSDTEPDCGE